MVSLILASVYSTLYILEASMDPTANCVHISTCAKAEIMPTMPG